MSNFPDKIKELRKLNNLSQKQLATSLNVSQNAVYNWENGKREPNLDMFKKIAAFFDIRLNMLLDDSYELINGEWHCNIKVDIDLNHPFNVLSQKLAKDESLTPEEHDYYIKYWNENIKEQLTQLPNILKKISEGLYQNYEMLNEEGQKKANNQLEHVADQIELLTKIPEYRKKQDQPE